MILKRFSVLFKYKNNEEIKYNINSENYQEDSIENILKQLIHFYNSKKEMSICICHDIGISFISNKNLIRLEFSDDVWEVLDYDTNKVEEIFSINLK